VESAYRQQDVEERWQLIWESEGLYNADAADPRPTFVDAHPPPNVTGELHLGHALQVALGDTIVRMKRMQGYNTLFQPGYDHAGISTQSVVEKQLEREGTSRHEIGREAFEQRVWDWLHEYGGKIMHQFRRLGASLDYRRERFTMDEAYVRAVSRFFVHLYEKGWIYRANRIINWCPYHATSLSDLELDNLEVDDKLYTIRYPLADGSGHVAIATVRPATIPGDVALAVHPEDERYRSLIGREVVVPFVERRVPIIADARVERDFGTGVLKVTPGHDPVDFAIGRDHGLPEPVVIGPDGRMNDEEPRLAGLTQKAAGERILGWSRERDLVVSQERYRHTVPICARCATRIEPVISPQWWCAMGELKQPAIRSLEAGRVRFHPESQHRFAIRSLEDAPDWCISRQIWWGHQLPIWYCPDEHLTVAADPPEACAECGSVELVRETDVLDTWFSSALWPLATLGWPNDTDDLRAFYPGDIQTTDRGIIRLWENRMIFAALELTGTEPFENVVIHSTVLAPDGQRMSKSLGTGINPLDTIAKFGADATRFGLLKMSSVQDAKFNVTAIDQGRRLTIKLWNVARLIISNADGAAPAVRPQALEERWILARIDGARARIEDLLGRFEFALAVDTLYHLTFDDFCDWYAEAIKPRLYGGDPDAAATALAALERLLKLLHPVLPHITEEIWTNLPQRAGRLIVAPWPEPEPEFAGAADGLQNVQAAAAVFRRSGAIPALSDQDDRRIFEAVVRPRPTTVEHGVELERARLRERIAHSQGKLANDGFLQHAPPRVVAGERDKLDRFRRELELLASADDG